MQSSPFVELCKNNGQSVIRVAGGGAFGVFAVGTLTSAETAAAGQTTGDDDLQSLWRAPLRADLY